MASIDPELIKALMERLGVGKSRVYARISKLASARFLENDLAALMVAQESGINVKKYSTAQQRSELRSNVDRSFPAMREEVSQARVSTPKVGGKNKKPKDGRSVFVVHGRNAKLREQVFVFLRSLNLRPLEWGTAIKEAKRGANPNVEDIIDACMAKVQAVLVLFSPDEEVRLIEKLRSSNDGDQFTHQPRPNVIFEAGLALGRHPEKTLLVEVGKVRGFSDIAGRHMARLDGSPGSRNDIVARLRLLGCVVDVTGTDWLTAGDLSI